jgi:peptide/nickel transport system substrate-binding protein
MNATKRSLAALALIALTTAACSPKSAPTAEPTATTVVKSTPTSVAAPVATSVAGAPDTAADTTPTTAAAPVLAPADPAATVVAHVFEDPIDLSPDRSQNRSLMRYVYDPLFVSTLDGEMLGVVAESWESTVDSVSFTIRDGITCSDDSALTPQDVKASLEYALDPARVATVLTGLVTDNDHVVAVDGDVVTVTSSAPELFLLSALSAAPMICAAGLANIAGLADTPVGSGPFRFVSSTPGDRYEFERRDGYTWGAGGEIAADRLPAKVTVRVVTDGTTVTNLLLTGELNTGTVGGLDKQRIRDAGLTGPALDQYTLMLYVQSDPTRLTSSEAVRQAVIASYEPQLVQLTAGGDEFDSPRRLAAQGTEQCNRDTMGALPAFGQDNVDRLLTGDGWTRDGDGWTKGGKPLELTLVYAAELPPGTISALEYMVSAWKDAGIDVQLESVPRANMVERTDNRLDWDLNVEFSGSLNPVQIGNYVAGDVPPAGLNFTRTVDPIYDAIAAKAAVLPIAEGCSLWLDAEEQILRAGRIAPLFVVSTTIVLSGIEAKVQVNGDIVPGTLVALA